MVKTLSPQHRRLKLKVIKDGEEYPYDIDQDGNYITYPLTLGSGQYEIRDMRILKARGMRSCSSRRWTFS